MYAVNYTVMSTTMPSAFTAKYPFLSETLVGICYLSTGVGMVLGSAVTGKLLGRDYARLVTKREGSGAAVPVEHARLRMSPALLLVFIAAVIAWGWCIHARVSIAAPLVVQVILGYTSIAVLNSTMTRS